MDNNLFIGMGQGLNFDELLRRLEYWTNEIAICHGNELRTNRATASLKILHRLLKTRRLVTSPLEGIR